jgi:hypothetical protein
MSVFVDAAAPVIGPAEAGPVGGRNRMTFAASSASVAVSKLLGQAQ